MTSVHVDDSSWADLSRAGVPRSLAVRRALARVRRGAGDGSALDVLVSAASTLLDARVTVVPAEEGVLDPPASDVVSKTSISVPLIVDGRVVGAVTAVPEFPHGPGSGFTDDDRDTLAALSAAASGALVGGPSVLAGRSSASTDQPRCSGCGPSTGRVPVQSGSERVGGAAAATPDADAAATPDADAAATPDAGEALGARSGLSAARALTGIAFWEWTPCDGRLVWSPEMFRLAGLLPEDGTPSLARWHELIHPEDLDRAKRLDLHALGRTTGCVEVFRVIGADGVVRHLRAWSLPTTSDDGERVVQGAAVEVTAEVRDRLRLDLLSSTDALTGLGNRAAIERRITQLLADREREVFLLLLDLDRFKFVNDSLGHRVGDRLLVEVARRLRSVVPGGSLTARMGGDEFVVVPHPGTDHRNVRRLARRIVDTLRRPYVLPDSGEMLVCPVSVGVTSRSGRNVGAEDLLSEADLALYQAKDSGRDRYVFFDDALRSRARERRLTEQLLRSALRRDWLTLRYQPISALRTGAVVGAEALVRINDPAEGELVLPDCFIEVAEDTGLVVELDCWVIDNALTEVARWAAAARGERTVPWLAVNVSARSMEHPRVVKRLLDGLRRRGLPPRSIKVELTEHSFLGTLPGGESNLRHLLASGVPVGIDDFGTGYSALAYLQRFDLDFMKIDRSFVVSVGEDDRADAVVTAMVGLAHAHGMQVTAEGIENSRQARRLTEIGCDFAQGYHVGRPVEAARLPH
ncbi:MAG: hypothetical protein QG622_3439 [Actinomycetota bacterium]|nr:hypothetical protein [Actinomycetota bacterium]